MLSISPLSFDPRGGVRLVGVRMNDNAVSRRMSRRMLLDGSVSIYDGGYSDGDRTLSASARVGREPLTRLRELIRDYNRLVLALPDGVYHAAITDVDYAAPEALLTIWIERRI